MPMGVDLLAAIGDDRHGLKPSYCLGIGHDLAEHVWIEERLSSSDVELHRSMCSEDR